jgi:hypothetical protein
MEIYGAFPRRFGDLIFGEEPYIPFLNNWINVVPQLYVDNKYCTVKLFFFHFDIFECFHLLTAF